MAALDELDGDELVVLEVAHQPRHAEVPRPDVPHRLVLFVDRVARALGKGRGRRRRGHRRRRRGEGRGGGDGGEARRIERRAQVARGGGVV